MPPLNLDNTINTVSLVGTWLGSLFTGIGLLAVISQLQSFVMSASRQQTRQLVRASGIWAPCVNKMILPDKGTIEQVAPAISGWIQHHYLHRISTKLTQSTNKTSGTSSWSKLFQQCSILPHELEEYGGSQASIYHPGKAIAQTPIQADLCVEGGRVLYGLSSAEFAVLMIICGYSVHKFTESDRSVQMQYLGRIELAQHGPFSQILQFDAYSGADVMQTEVQRLAHDVPIRDSLHLALGMLELTPSRGDRKWIIFPRTSEIQSAESQRYRHWSATPRMHELNGIRFGIEQMVQVSGREVMNYTVNSANCEAHEIALIKQFHGQDENLRYREALLSAYAIDSLRPWGLKPVAPSGIVLAIVEVIDSFVASRVESVGLLANKLRHDMANSTVETGWRDFEEQAEALDALGEIKRESFSGSANYCAYYYGAMRAVFAEAGLEFSLIRKLLAAAVAWEVLHSGQPPIPHDGNDDTGKMSFLTNLLQHLDESGQATAAEVETQRWALKIYAAYLWGWLYDRIELESEVVGGLTAQFRRRIFVG